MEKIYYHAGYDYVLAADAVFMDTAIRPDSIVETDFIRLHPNGTLLIHRGYAWNGANFCIDTPHLMVPSLFHDAVVQLFHLGLLDGEKWATVAAQEFRRLCIESGMKEWMADFLYSALEKFGHDYCANKYNEPVLTA